MTFRVQKTADNDRVVFFKPRMGGRITQIRLTMREVKALAIALLQTIKIE